MVAIVDNIVGVGQEQDVEQRVKVTNAVQEVLT